ncbi:L10-interacting MYB domain-containing protein-like [Castanea sativa]|uniref:L10-interacting MYB domain-containing protein-like n=1 Tax=Castanea sativa TaxID=21020 RepID=UPI003F650B44
MENEQQKADDKMWPPHVEFFFIDIMLEEQVKGNMENGVFKGPMWLAMTNDLNAQIGKNFLTKQVIQKHNRLWKKQRKLTQLLKHTGLGWDEIMQNVTCAEEVWAYVVAGAPKAANLRKNGCPNYDELKQLFAPSTATGALQISSNTPALDSDEERALEEEMAN